MPVTSAETRRQRILLQAKDRRHADGNIDFVGLHNLAKHLIFFREASEAAMSTVKGLHRRHKDLFRTLPQDSASTQIMNEVDELLLQKITQFGVLVLRTAATEKRMQNIISLVSRKPCVRRESEIAQGKGQAFNTVTQQDSFMMRNDSRTMKAIAFVTIFFLPITTVAVS